MADTKDGWCFICRGRPLEQCNHTLEDFDRACARRNYDIDGLESRVRADERRKVLGEIEAYGQRYPRHVASYAAGLLGLCARLRAEKEGGGNG